MIKLSAGSAIELGLLNSKNDIPPKTAYIMIGKNCNNSCSFCTQSIKSENNNKLSRVVWPEYSKEEIVQAIKKYKGENIKRICIQAMENDESYSVVNNFIEFIKDKIDIPISLSARLDNTKDIEKYLNLGVEKIGIAIDACNEDIYRDIKGGNFNKKIEFIINASKKFKSKISSHIIVGLGETHEDIYEVYSNLIKNGVTISLFAFTPIKGTKLQNKKQPDIKNYRRVQLMIYMIKKGYAKEFFEFENGYINNIYLDDNIKEDINSGYPFETSGCINCNRPYYNERPKGVIYNYASKLSLDDIELTKKQLELNEYLCI